MDERPGDPNIERQEVVERREVVERDLSRGADVPADRVVVHQRPGPGPWLWLIPLLIVVLLLLWYVFTRGQPTQLQLPNIEAPVVESPQPDRRIEIQLPERQPAQQPAATTPAEPAAVPEPAAEPQP